MSLRSLFPALLAGLGLLGIGCQAPSEDDGAANEAITKIENTSVKKQVVGNCWLYGTMGWIEGLHLKATGEKLDLSESYLTFWHWFDVLTAGYPDAKTATAALDQGAFFEDAAYLVTRYGLMAEKDFVPDTGLLLFAGGDDQTALDAVDAALWNHDSPLGRAMAKQDPVAVARELARLWKLPASLVSDLLTTFGTAGQKTFLDGATPSTKSKIIKPSSLLVASVDQKTHAVRTMPVTDIVAGGSEAWLTLSAPADAATNHAARRDFERWVQRALNAGFPVPVVWNVEPDAMTPGGRFEASRIKDTRGGPHLSLMFDYEVRDVPGFGTLPAGVRESRAAALSASLDDRANISFFRIKNSWGLIPPTAAEAVQRLLPGTAPYGDDDIEPAYAYHWAPEGQFYIYLPPGL